MAFVNLGVSSIDLTDGGSLLVCTVVCATLSFLLAWEVVLVGKSLVQLYQFDAVVLIRPFLFLLLLLLHHKGIFAAAHIISSSEQSGKALHTWLS